MKSYDYYKKRALQFEELLYAVTHPHIRVRTIPVDWNEEIKVEKRGDEVLATVRRTK